MSTAQDFGQFREPCETDDNRLNSSFENMCVEVGVLSAWEYAHQPFGYAILGVSIGYLAIILGIFIHEVVFITRNFKLRSRRSKTIWVLALYPVFGLCCTIGVTMPRAGPLVDLVMDTYLASSLYQFLQLVLDYLGDPYAACSADKLVTLRGPPVCCLCFCLPQVPFTRKNFDIFYYLVLQVTVIRPITSFIVAVLWAEGSYTPGYVAADNAYVYLTCISLTSTVTCTYSLMFLQRGLSAHVLAYSTGGKWLCLMFVLLMTLIPSLVIGILSSRGVIPCTNQLSSKSRGDRIYHGFVLFICLPLALLARRAYLRRWEGSQIESREANTTQKILPMATPSPFPRKSVSTISNDAFYDDEWPNVEGTIRCLAYSSFTLTRDTSDAKHTSGLETCPKESNGDSRNIHLP